MKRGSLYVIIGLCLGLAVFSGFLPAQGTRADTELGASLREKLQPPALNLIDGRGWIEKTSRLPHGFQRLKRR